MDTQKIRFVANRPGLTDESPSRPRPTTKTIPDWYRDAARYAMDASTGKAAVLPDGAGKAPTWKACPAMFDVMASGYTFVTPCDIQFTESGGSIQAQVLDPTYKDFLVDRDPLPQFVNPQGYHHKHFAWFPDWALELPPGYSALYTQPLNRFELPFLTVSGIIDNDKVNLPGTMPFFFMRGLSGILPAGMPYAQIFPFRREHWASEIDTSLGDEAIAQRNRANSDKFRKPDGGVYLREVWERRKYQ